jgi:hypothetical protein
MATGGAAAIGVGVLGAFTRNVGAAAAEGVAVRGFTEAVRDARRASSPDAGGGMRGCQPGLPGPRYGAVRFALILRIDVNFKTLTATALTLAFFAPGVFAQAPASPSASVAAAKSAVGADKAAVKADKEKLKKDKAAHADLAVLKADQAQLDSDRAKLKADKAQLNSDKEKVKAEKPKQKAQAAAPAAAASTAVK